MYSAKRSLIRYPIFQIPLICLGVCLLITSLFWLLQLGRPNVSIAVALDISGSTHSGKPFNSSGTILAQSVDAVKAYLQANTSLGMPNQIKILGMGGGKAIELTSSFQQDGQQIEADLVKAMQDPKLPQS
ncbi:MAG: hypothetical protein VKJ24_07980, partial [Synechococcales bacterium]|nr:hypothetical protein [Synechococcales bacterium]